MDLLLTVINLFLHLDKHVVWLLAEYGQWFYLILFTVIFCETGLVFTPFLPGDSLLFIVGSFAALGSLNVGSIIFLLGIAAILGNAVNYAVGYFIGQKLFDSPKVPFLNKNHLIKTQQFYAKHGGKTIVIARFMPIIRTMAPFVAGIGKMNAMYFMLYNVVGCIAWILTFTLGGYFFGNIPIVKEYLTAIVFGIIFISLLPVIIQVIKHKKETIKK